MLMYSARAEPTYVSGVINENTTWVLVNSPYIVTEDIQIPSGVTLTIEPGVEIQYTGAYEILIQGSIIANGTEADNIVFTSASAGTSSGARQLMFKGAVLNSSTLSHIKMEYAWRSIQIGEETEHNQGGKNEGTLTVSHVTINEADVITDGYTTGARLVLTDATITSSTIRGTYPRSEEIIIQDAVISNCNINSDSYNLGITIENSTVTNSQFSIGCCGANIHILSSIVLDSIIQTGGGSPVTGPLEITSSKLINTTVNLPVATVEVSNCTVNYSGSNGLIFGNGLIEYSHVVGNGKGVAVAITGYYGYNIGGSVSITNSTIVHNSIGVKVTGANIFTMQNSNIFDNAIYNVENLASTDITATNNYWATANAEEIATTIFDHDDDINYGIVDYSNYITSPNTDAPISPPINANKTAVDGDVQLAWASNLESDLAGYNIYYGSPTGYSFANVVDVGNVRSYTLSGVSASDIIAVSAYDTQADGIDDQLEGHESWFAYPVRYQVLTVYTSGVSSSNPITVSFSNETVIGTADDDHPLNITMYTNMVVDIGAEDSLVWSVGNNTRYKFTAWTGTATGTNTTNPIQLTLVTDTSCTANYKTQHHSSLIFNDSNESSSLYTDPSHVQALAPNGGLVTFNSYSNLWLDNGTWTIKQIRWQGNNVKPSTDPTYAPTPGGTWTINCGVYLISFSNSFKDNNGNDLYTLPSSFKLAFPNSTTSVPLNPNSSYHIQNGTITWNSITWQGTEVCPSNVSFNPANGNLTVNTRVYTLKTKNVDHFNNLLDHDVTLTFPNGTTLTKTPSFGWINLTQVQYGTVITDTPITVSETERYMALNSTSISLTTNTIIDSAVWRHDFKVTIGFKDDSETYILSRLDNFTILMQNGTSVYNSPPYSWMPTGTTTLTAVTWQGSNVRPQTAPTLIISSSTTYYYSIRVYHTAFATSQFKDSNGNTLYSPPSTFELIFPNETISESLRSGASYLIQNGTAKWSSIIWLGTEVVPEDTSFDPTNGNPTVNCKVHSLTIDPTFNDNASSVLYTDPSSLVITFPNGTEKTISSSVTFNQTQTGNYSIANIMWQGTDVVPDVTPSILLTPNTSWSPNINCRVFSLSFAFTDDKETIEVFPSYWLVEAPNGTVSELTGSISQAQVGTWKLVAVMWRGTHVVPQVNPTILLASNSQWAIRCRVYLITISWVDNAHIHEPVMYIDGDGVAHEVIWDALAGWVENESGDEVYIGDFDDIQDYLCVPDEAEIEFPNGTTLTVSPPYTFLVQNGICIVKKIVWQSSNIIPSVYPTFDAVNGNPTVEANVYSIRFGWKDTNGVWTIMPSQFTIQFPNGTLKTVTSNFIHQTQNGTYTITEIMWQDYNVTPVKHPSATISNDCIWIINCEVASSVDVYTSASTTYVGFQVNISGVLNNQPAGYVSGVTVILSYRVPGVSTWNLITTVTTESDGSFGAIWIPSATGYYTINASWVGNEVYPEANAAIDLAITPVADQYVFSVTSNSTVSALAFNSTSRELSFTASGPSGTSGYVKVAIAKNLVANATDIKVYLDGNPMSYTVKSLDDSWLLHFTYNHSDHVVTIELALTAITPWQQQYPWILIVAATAAVAILGFIGLTLIKRKRLHSAPTHERMHAFRCT